MRVHLLRAVNVGGARLPMAELRALAEGLGAADVRTHIASGNLVCTPPGDGFDRALERAVEARFGFFREVISRSADELEAALAAHPFDLVDAKHSHVYFLQAVPDAAAVATFDAADWSPDDVRVVGADLHVRYGDGIAGSRLTPQRIHSALGTVGTGRNLTTVRALLEMLR